ncbi:hypothetical protein JHL21_12355 [Devosia sp. WQ 349]|uniref:hypothetical protein n=1 Tax=Devosia sp. WQ 349K1 TaxID=2800329 RepID=UPI001908BC40|nr:hypothetical protein [Devosia sp. WQ 349K1]MBK1795289.1 hypothetical protein [Devosia sp. WQ 349K1]
MSAHYSDMPAKEKGAWISHHAQKTSAVMNAAAEFPALDAAGKSATLLSQLSSNDETRISAEKVDVFARASGINPRTELPSLLSILQSKRLIDRSSSGEVAILGLTTSATVQHAFEIFEGQAPSKEERASIVLADISSAAPLNYSNASQVISDEFRLSGSETKELLERAERIGFVDGENDGDERILFNGNLFRRDSVTKTKAILSSVTHSESERICELEALLLKHGAIPVSTAEATLSVELFAKLRAAGMYDVNHVINTTGEYGFITRPAAFHKFNDPLSDDAFDLAKALVAALSYGMTQRTESTGRIEVIAALLRKLNAGRTIGPATAIGEDYKVLELKGVIETWPGEKFGHYMRLRKTDIGEMALAVLTTGEAASANAIDRPFSGSMSGFAGPEATRSDFRQKKQSAPSKIQTRDILAVLRTGGGM